MSNKTPICGPCKAAPSQWFDHAPEDCDAPGKEGYCSHNPLCGVCMAVSGLRAGKRRTQ